MTVLCLVLAAFVMSSHDRCLWDHVLLGVFVGLLCLLSIIRLHHAEARIEATVARLEELGLLRLIGTITCCQGAGLVAEALTSLHDLRAVERVLLAQVHGLLVVVLSGTLQLLRLGR